MDVGPLTPAEYHHRRAEELDRQSGRRLMLASKRRFLRELARAHAKLAGHAEKAAAGKAA